MRIEPDAESGPTGEIDRRYQVIGIESSPYTVKVRAVMRYRHLPYIWVCRFPQFEPATRHIRPALMPVVRFPGGDFHVDSTPIILALEKRHAPRSVCPDDPVLNFYSGLIEDMADEWLTKLVYFFRFGNSADRRFGSMWVTDDSNPGLSDAELVHQAEQFAARQDARKDLVGATAANTAALENSFDRLIEAMRPLMASGGFLFGSRPSLADFGLFAQLHTLSADPTPSAIIREKIPRLEYWVRRAHDLSGIDGIWQSTSKPTEAVVGLLRMAGDIYLPFLDANFEAAAAGADRFDVVLDGFAFSQPTFRYHVKCLAALRAAFAALPATARDQARPLLSETGCLKFLQGPCA